VEQLKPIVRAIRGRFARANLVSRGDSGFAREELMSWCDENNVHFVLGLARNARLQGEIEAELKQAEGEHQATAKQRAVLKT
jgi:hypothetical protein